MNEKPRRCWFRFSLSTFLLLVTAICVWIGWKHRIVRERRELRALILERQRLVQTDWRPNEPPRLPWLRSLLGDEPWFATISLCTHNWSVEEENRIRSAFPEARIVVGGSPRE
jgi:hypothetical protein